MHTPNGLCVDCRLRLVDWINKKESPRKLRIVTGVELWKVDRESRGKCGCYICHLGNMFGGELNRARALFKKQKDPQVAKGSDLRRCNKCFAAISKSNPSNHVCCGKKDTLANLKEVISPETRLQLALDTLKEVSGASGDSSFKVQSVNGGQPTTITLGNPAAFAPEPPKLKVLEVQTLGSGAHLTGGKRRKLLADPRSKFGRSFVESGVEEQLTVLNARFLPFFTCTRTNFEKGDTMVERPLFFCQRTVDFLKEVALLRGHEWHQLSLLVQGDSGQLWFKLSVSLIHLADLEEKEKGRKRRTREEGIGGGSQYCSYGVRKILILALVQNIPETSYNLSKIFRCVYYQSTFNFSYQFQSSTRETISKTAHLSANIPQ